MIKGLKIGVRVHDFGKQDAHALASNAKAMGFDGVQLVLNKALPSVVTPLNADFCTSIGQAFTIEGLDIVMLGSYFNPVHHNQELVASNIKRFVDHLCHCKYFPSALVGTETGSYNDDKWTYNPQNRTEAAFLQIQPIFRKLADVAKDNDSYLAIEGAAGHCCYNPRTLKRLFDTINNGHVKIIVDLYNYLDLTNYQTAITIFEECLTLFGDDIVIFHLKDFIISDGALKQVGLGQGMMPFAQILPLIKQKCPNAYLVFEGVQPVDMASSLQLIKTILE